MKTITTSKGKFMAVDLPEHSSNIRIETNQSYVPYCYMIMYDTPPTIDSYGYKQTESFNLPQGNWLSIGKLSEATEEDAEVVVYKSEAFQLYRNYLKIVEFGNKMEFTSALDSLNSLLKSKGIDINNGNWYLFKKI